MHYGKVQHVFPFISFSHSSLLMYCIWTCMITCLQNIEHSFECSYYLGINVATHLNMWWHFAKIIEPLSCFSCRVVSAPVINDKALMHSFLCDHLQYVGSQLTEQLKVNRLCSHFVWSPENQNILTIWRLDSDNVKRRGQKSKHNLCVPTSIRIELNGACDRSGAAVTSLEELYLPR